MRDLTWMSIVNVECAVDGSDSSDNVGIVSFTWEFDDDGPVVINTESFDLHVHDGGHI